MASVSPRQIFCLPQEPPPLSELHVASKLARQSYSAAVDTLSSLPKPQVLEAQAKLWAGNGTQLTLLSMKYHLHSKLQTQRFRHLFPVHHVPNCRDGTPAPLPTEGCVWLWWGGVCTPHVFSVLVNRLTVNWVTDSPRNPKQKKTGITE